MRPHGPERHPNAGDRHPDGFREILDIVKADHVEIFRQPDTETREHLSHRRTTHVKLAAERAFRGLTPARQLTLLGEMRQLAQRDSQFIVATHSPILMAYPGARIYLLSESGIEPVQYRETEHYQLTKRFLEDPERMLRYLLEE